MVSCSTTSCGRESLLQLYLSADFLELLLQFLGLVLGDTFLDGLGGSLDRSLGLSQAQAGNLADSLDDLDLLSADFGQRRRQRERP